MTFLYLCLHFLNASDAGVHSHHLSLKTQRLTSRDDLCQPDKPRQLVPTPAFSLVCSYSQSRYCEPHMEEKAETGLRWGSSALSVFPCCGVYHIPGSYLCPVSKLQVLHSRVKLVFEVEFPKTCSKVKEWTMTCRFEDLPSLQDCRNELDF